MAGHPAGLIAHHDLAVPGERHRLDGHGGFLEDFPDQRLGEGFAGLHHAARHGPDAERWAAGTPRDAVLWLQREIAQAVRHPDLRDVLVEKQGFEPVGSDPDSFRNAILRDLDRYTRIAQMAGLQMN